MTPKPAPYAPPYTLRRFGQPQEQDLPKLIPAEWTWVSYENHDAVNYSCRNKHLGPTPPLRLMPTTFNCRYSQHLIPHNVRGTVPGRYWQGPGTPKYIVYMGKPSPGTLALFQPFINAPQSHTTTTRPLPLVMDNIVHPHTRRPIDPTRVSHPPLIPRGWPTLTPT